MQVTLKKSQLKVHLLRCEQNVQHWSAFVFRKPVKQTHSMNKIMLMRWHSTFLELIRRYNRWGTFRWITGVVPDNCQSLFLALVRLMIYLVWQRQIYCHALQMKLYWRFIVHPHAKEELKEVNIRNSAPGETTVNWIMRACSCKWGDERFESSQGSHPLGEKVHYRRVILPEWVFNNYE